MGTCYSIMDSNSQDKKGIRCSPRSLFSVGWLGGVTCSELILMKLGGRQGAAPLKILVPICIQGWIGCFCFCYMQIKCSTEGQWLALCQSLSFLCRVSMFPMVWFWFWSLDWITCRGRISEMCDQVDRFLLLEQDKLCLSLSALAEVCVLTGTPLVSKMVEACPRSKEETQAWQLRWNSGNGNI